MTWEDPDPTQPVGVPRAAGIERALLPVTALAITAVVLGLRFGAQATRQFDPDELEHAHLAWSIAQGALPYRDLFEHHTPLFHYLLAALLGPLHPERSGEAGLGALLLAREVTWGVSALQVVLGFIVLVAALRESIPGRAWSLAAVIAWVAASAALLIVATLAAWEVSPIPLRREWWLVSLVCISGSASKQSTS